MENRNQLGSARTAAAILLLWEWSYMFAQVLVINSMGIGHMSISAEGWISRLCTLGLIVLLFMGKRNIGFVIVESLVVLLSVWNLIDFLSIYNFIWLVADVSILVVVLFATVPSLGGNKHPFRNLEFIPAGLNFLPFIIILFVNIFSRTPGPQGAISFVNAIIGSLGYWFMARAMTDYGTAENAPAYATYATYATASAQPQARQAQPAPQPAASAVNEPGTLLVRFSIDKLNKLSGSYGFQSGNLIGQAIPPSMLEGMTISDGDSAATLQGREYVCVVSISTSFNRSLLKEQIEPRIASNEQVRACGAAPLTQLVSSTSEPLVADGIVRNGKIEGPGGWCASGLMSAWKEHSEA